MKYLSRQSRQLAFSQPHAALETHTCGRQDAPLYRGTYHLTQRGFPASLNHLAAAEECQFTSTPYKKRIWNTVSYSVGEDLSKQPETYTKCGALQLHQLCRHSWSFTETWPARTCYMTALLSKHVRNISEALHISQALCKHLQLIRDREQEHPWISVYCEDFSFSP